MLFAPKRRVPPSFTEPSRHTHAHGIWKTSIGHVDHTIKRTHNHLSYTKRSLRGVTHPSTAREVVARAAAARMAAREAAARVATAREAVRAGGEGWRCGLSVRAGGEGWR